VILLKKQISTINRKKKLPNKNENENEGVTPLEARLMRAIMTVSPDPAERFTGGTFLM
jgi:hypothetical protein